MPKKLLIDDISREYNLTKPTLRYYENFGLISKVVKNDSGNREYSKQNLDEINFVVCMRRTGLTLKQIKNFLDLYEQGEDTMEERLSILLTQKEKVLKNIQDLNDTLDYLDYKIDYYKGNMEEK